MEVLEGDAERDRLSRGPKLGEHICRLVECTGYVMVLASLEASAELLYEEPVGGHVCIFDIPIAWCLLDDEVGVAEA